MPTSLGPAEILVILVLALIVLGPERLPKAARQLGRALGEVRRWSSNVQEDLRGALEDDEDPAPSIAAVPDRQPDSLHDAAQQPALPPQAPDAPQAPGAPVPPPTDH